MNPCKTINIDRNVSKARIYHPAPFSFSFTFEHYALLLDCMMPTASSIRCDDVPGPGMMDTGIFSVTPEGEEDKQEPTSSTCWGEEDKQGEEEIEQDSNSLHQPRPATKVTTMLISLVLQVTLANDPSMDSGVQSGKCTLHG